MEIFSSAIFRKYLLSLIICSFFNLVFVMVLSQGGHSVLGSGPSVIDEIQFLENGSRSVPKKFRNRAFRFSVISVRFRF